MADHFVSLNRGEQGFTSTDFTTATVSTAGDAIELRVADAAGLSKKDIQIALEAFERFFQNWQQVVAAGFVVSG